MTTRSGSITIINTKDIIDVKNYYLATSLSSGVTKDTSGWSESVQTIDSNRPYLWNYEDIIGTGNVVVNSTTPTIIGRYGTDGRGVVSIIEYYKIGDSGTVPPTGTWSDTPEEMTPINKYLWNYEVINYTTGLPTETAKKVIGVYGEKGEEGLSVESITERWANSNSNTEHPAENSNDWKDNAPIYDSTKPYYWIKTITNYTDGTSSAPTYRLDEKTAADKRNIYLLQVATKYSGWNSTGTYVASGISGVTFDSDNTSTFGYNTLMATTGLALRYNALRLAQLSTSMLTFYDSPTSGGVEGAEVLTLGNGEFALYTPSKTSHYKLVSLTTGGLVFNDYNGNNLLNISSAGFLQSGNYSYTSGSYSAAGTKIDLTNGSITSKNFAIDSSGNANFKGYIEASSGKIGQWNIGTDTSQSLWYGNSIDAPTFLLSKGKTLNSSVGGSGTGLEWMIKADNKFGVTTDGALYTISGKIGGFSIGEHSLSIDNNDYYILLTNASLSSSVTINGYSSTDWAIVSGTKFGVLNDGSLYCNNAKIKGEIEATSGKIGGCNIVDGTLQVTNANISGILHADIIEGGTFNTDDYIWVSSQDSRAIKIGDSANNKINWRIIAGKKFGVDGAGNVYATNVNLEGTITATGGTIGGCTIDNSGTLHITNVNIDDLDVTKLTGGTIDASHIDTSSITISEIKTDSNNYAKITSDGLLVVGDGEDYGKYGSYGLTIYGKISANKRGIIAQIYSGTGNNESGQAIAPYYTFGTRKSNEAIGNYSFAAGIDVISSGYSSHAEGINTTSNGHYTHAEGKATVATGQSSHAEGWYSQSLGECSHAEGRSTTVYYITGSTFGGHAEGELTSVYGSGGHAEGYSSEVGRAQTSSLSAIKADFGAHSEGWASKAYGQTSHAEGTHTEAKGAYTHTQNVYTIADRTGQTAIGRYNVADTDTSSNYGRWALAIGNGVSESARSNCFEVQWNGKTIANCTGYSDNEARIQLNINNTAKLFMGVGSGGDNHGIYSSEISKWLIYSNGSNEVHTGTTFYTHGSCRPASKDDYSVGSGDYRWNAVYAKNTTIQTSDKKEKDVLGDIEFAHDLILNLQPIKYMWKDGDHRRTRMGFIAQDTAKLCNNMGLNLNLYTASYKQPDVEEGKEKPYYGEQVDDKLLNWGMAYEELIAPMVQVIQDQHKEIEELKVKVQNLIDEKEK